MVAEVKGGHYRITKDRPHLVSALGAIPKSDGEFRIIHDCSQPPGAALNDYMRVEGKMKYQTLQDVINGLKP